MSDSEYIHKSHNVSALIYHLVCPAKYRRVIFDDDMDAGLKQICLEIEKRYEVRFLEIGVDKDHVHFLVQSVPTYSPSKIAQMIKSITAKQMFKRYPQMREILWGGEFWSKGYFMSSVGKHGDESQLRNYVKNQGAGKSGSKEYKALHQAQLKLF